MSDQTEYLLRPDLVISEQESGFVVMDPTAQSFTRLGSAEMLVARQFDGRSSLGVIRTRLHEERGVEAPLERLERFRDRLAGLGLIVRPGEAPSATSTGQALAARSTDPLSMKLFEFDPGDLLDALERASGWLFRPPAPRIAGIVVAAAGLLAALALAAGAAGGRLAADAAALGSPAGLALIVGAILVSVPIHELAHGLAAVSSGVRVPRMGVLLHHLLPAFYTDVSQSWLLPDQRRRQMVLLAGPAASVGLFAVAILGWSLLPERTVGAQLALALALVNLFGTLRTLLPLLPGDGYLLLSDALGRPNLRQVAFAQARAWTWQRLGRSAPARGLAPAPSRGALAYAFGALLASALMVAVGVVVLAWAAWVVIGAAIGSPPSAGN